MASFTSASASTCVTEEFAAFVSTWACTAWMCAVLAWVVLLYTFGESSTITDTLWNLAADLSFRAVA